MFHARLLAILACSFAFLSVQPKGIKRPERSALQEAKIYAQSVADLIYSRFELHRDQQQQLFLTTFNIPITTWDHLKLALVKKFLQIGANFTMVFTGTSVTAGYDNYLHQSYPMLVEAHLKPIFKALNMGLVVRNMGQTHVDCRLSNYCIMSSTGNADFIGWENSFDCGNAKDSHEFIARIAAWQNAVVLYSVSGSLPLDNCPPTESGPPYVSKDWTPHAAGIITRIAPTKEEVRRFRDLHNQWHAKGSSAARFTKALGDHYSGVGAHGFSLWTKTAMQCEFYDMSEMHPSSMLEPNTMTYGATPRRKLSAQAEQNAQPAHGLRPRRSRPGGHRHANNSSHTSGLPGGGGGGGGGGRHRSPQDRPAAQRVGIRQSDPIQACEAVRLIGACASAGGPKWRTLESGQYGNSQKTGRKWHPSVGMHVLRAEVLVFTYVQIILDAIYYLEEELDRLPPDAAMVTKAPEDKKGASWFAGWFGKKETKHEGADNAQDGGAIRRLHADISAQLAAVQAPPPSTPLHCSVEECQQPPQCYTNYQPHHVPAHRLSTILVGSHMGWYEEAAVANDQHPELGLLDKKFYFKSEGAKNEIHFRITGLRSALRVYARSKKEPLDECLFLLDPLSAAHGVETVQSSTGGKERPSFRPSPQRFSLTPYLNAGNSSEEVRHFSGLPPGDYVLTVMTSPTNPYTIVSLSHIVVF